MSEVEHPEKIDVAQKSSGPRSRVIPIAPSSGDDSGALYEVRKKIYPRALSGWFATWRWVLVAITQAVFYLTPWLRWNGRPLMLFDLAARKFFIGSFVFWPQDFIYLSLLLIASALALFLFTALGGRLWCGYACPQTVYTELFLLIERKVEGNRHEQLRLDRGPRDFERLAKKTIKHVLWILLSLYTGLTFVGYFTPIRTLIPEIWNFGVGPWETFWVFFYGFATYGNAGFMREQVCKYMCPYARFQSAMFDRDTLIVTYDVQRGEPRGSRSRSADLATLGLGSCVDCGVCVEVCPTGIDIREGLQYECIGCAACIDGCNQIMGKMGYPPGLIRYTTENALDGHWSKAYMWRRLVRPRVLAYAAILIALVGGTIGSLVTRVPLQMDVMRDRKALSRAITVEGQSGWIENTYRLQIMNMDEEPHRYRISVSGLPGIALEDSPEILIDSTESRTLAINARIPPEQLEPGSHHIFLKIEAEDAPRIQRIEQAAFLLPL